ncbi:hypothetical protein [Parasitella parasitica]|uniref:Uncharacterized protein n=1 Tax=Parasitella parasitica TaxID=35722 RepID=A0A0B7NLU9_9FUNG|nr:hypothetical protein [Parasitella parasitica]
MSKENRKALLTDVINHFKRAKMIELPSQIAEKYNKAIDKVKKPNITNAEYTNLEKKWHEHVTLAQIPATPAGINELIIKAESQNNMTENLLTCDLIQ